MTKRPLKNVAASVRQRLLNQARATGRPFSELVQYYAMERFLYRLSRSSHRDRFILKGALMLTAWRTPVSRPTKDIDLLGRVRNDVAAIVDAVRRICSTQVDPDGIEFDGQSLEAEAITGAADYEGIRVRFRGTLDTARIGMQLDIGFGDVVSPAPHPIEYPTILDFPAPVLMGYTLESAVAEKFQTMVKLGIINSRMRDFFDVWLLSRQFDFDGVALAAAFVKTFEKRNTAMPERPVALSTEFATDPVKVTQWAAFRRTSRLGTAPQDFAALVADLAKFLAPLASALAHEGRFAGTWLAPGPWREL